MKLELLLSSLQQRIGLNPDSLGPSAIAAVVQARMQGLGLTDLSAFAARVASSPGEFQSLVDDLVVPETWFFRGGELFSYLAQRVRAAVS
jgi:chemotaxis protein methyltransferase WspC